MYKKIPLSVHVVTALLLIYTILVSFNAPIVLTGMIFFVSPFFIVWMVISILKMRSPGTKELNEEEEWGYSDKNKEELGTF